MSSDHLNQALISATLPDFPNFEIVSVSPPEETTPFLELKKNEEKVDSVDHHSKQPSNNTLNLLITLFTQAFFDNLGDSITSNEVATDHNSSTISMKQGTPPILRRGNRRKSRHDSSYDAAS